VAFLINVQAPIGVSGVNTARRVPFLTPGPSAARI